VEPSGPQWGARGCLHGDRLWRSRKAIEGDPRLNLDQVIEQYHLALGEIVKGNPELYKQLFSHRDDVTLGNPFGPFARGWNQVAETLERAASNYKEGEATSFEIVSKHVTLDLACLVEVESVEAKVGGREDVTPVSLRCTTILRPEDSTWKVVHRHADPITSAQPAESVVQK
jgi:ketosteroid isomerase-like protein